MNIYIVNLPQSITEDELKQLVSPYGAIESIYIVKDTHTGMPKGSVYVIMPSEIEAQQAIVGLDGTEYQGQHLQVIRAEASDFPSGDYW